MESPDAEDLPLVEPPCNTDTGAQESSSSDDSALDTEDGDMEGLGMVLGEEKHESETG